jgi:hypothetical protein
MFHFTVIFTALFFVMIFPVFHILFVMSIFNFIEMINGQIE